MRNWKNISMIVVALSTALTGCSSTKTKGINDPLEGWNRDVQAFNDGVDQYVMKPLGKGYRWVTPWFVDKGVTNFFSNINDIGVATNSALQGKFQQSCMDGARFLVNTTAGVGGLIDVATEIDLPKHNEDFDQTLGYWGMGTGPYLVLPFLGPSSSRGVVGLIGDAAMNPISYTGLYFSSGISSAVSGGLGALHAIDARSDKLAIEKIASEAAVDRYEFFRNAYIKQREALVTDGKSVESDDPLKYQEQDFAPVSPYSK